MGLWCGLQRDGHPNARAQHLPRTSLWTQMLYDTEQIRHTMQRVRYPTQRPTGTQRCFLHGMPSACRSSGASTSTLSASAAASPVASKCGAWTREGGQQQMSANMSSTGANQTARNSQPLSHALACTPREGGEGGTGAKSFLRPPAHSSQPGAQRAAPQRPARARTAPTRPDAHAGAPRPSRPAQRPYNVKAMGREAGGGKLTSQATRMARFHVGRRTRATRSSRRGPCLRSVKLEPREVHSRPEGPWSPAPRAP
jgi:hypothetical protein